MLVGGLFVALAVPVAVFNLAVDPFDFRLTPRLELVREKIMRKNNPMLWSAGEFRRIPKAALDQVTMVAIGDSRTELLAGGRTSPRIFRLGSDVIFNLGVGGASFDDSIDSLKEFLPRLPRLKTVIFGVPLERIGVVEPNRAQDAFRQANSPVFYTLSLGTLRRSIDLLLAQASPSRAEPSRAEPNDRTSIPIISRRFR